MPLLSLNGVLLGILPRTSRSLSLPKEAALLVGHAAKVSKRVGSGDALLRLAFLGSIAVITPGSHTRMQNHTRGAVRVACLRNTILFKH